MSYTLLFIINDVLFCCMTQLYLDTVEILRDQEKLNISAFLPRYEKFMQLVSIYEILILLFFDTEKIGVTV